MRQDNFAILTHLLHINDPEVKRIFAQHQYNSATLLLELNSKTEEAYQVLLEQHLSNEEQIKLANKRNAKSSDYRAIWANFVPGLVSIGSLMG